MSALPTLPVPMQPSANQHKYTLTGTTKVGLGSKVMCMSALPTLPVPIQPSANQHKHAIIGTTE